MAKTASRLHRQVAALPYRRAPDGTCLILLATSRETKRWVIPKGNLIRGMAPHLAAAHEAFEEAGLVGKAASTACGSFCYGKRRKNGSVRETCVDVFPFAVAGQLEEWPERQQRETRWFAQDAAAESVDEPELAALIRCFSPPG